MSSKIPFKVFLISFRFDLRKLLLSLALITFVGFEIPCHAGNKYGKLIDENREDEKEAIVSSRQAKSAMQINELPSEVVLHVCHFLNPDEFRNLCISVPRLDFVHEHPGTYELITQGPAILGEIKKSVHLKNFRAGVNKLKKILSATQPKHDIDPSVQTDLVHDYPEFATFLDLTFSKLIKLLRTRVNRITELHAFDKVEKICSIVELIKSFPYINESHIQLLDNLETSLLIHREEFRAKARAVPRYAMPVPFFAPTAFPHSFYVPSSNWR